MSNSAYSAENPWSQKTVNVPTSHMRVASCFCPGLNRTSTFSCEAHNRKGVATSGSGTITGRCHTVETTITPVRPLRFVLDQGHLFKIVNYTVLLSFFSSPIQATQSESCGNHSDQFPFIVAPWFRGWLPNNTLLCSGETTWDKPKRKIPQLAE